MRLEMPSSSPRGSVGSMCADDAGVLAVEVEPDGRHQRATVRHDSGEIGDDPQAGDPIQYDGLRIEHDQPTWRSSPTITPSTCPEPTARR